MATCKATGCLVIMLLNALRCYVDFMLTDKMNISNETGDIKLFNSKY